jgi:hypothetical protein
MSKKHVIHDLGGAMMNSSRWHNEQWKNAKELLTRHRPIGINHAREHRPIQWVYNDRKKQSSLADTCTRSQKLAIKMVS